MSAFIPGLTILSNMRADREPGEWPALWLPAPVRRVGRRLSVASAAPGTPRPGLCRSESPANVARPASLCRVTSRGRVTVTTGPGADRSAVPSPPETAQLISHAPTDQPSRVLRRQPNSYHTPRIWLWWEAEIKMLELKGDNNPPDIF